MDTEIGIEIKQQVGLIFDLNFALFASLGLACL